MSREFAGDPDWLEQATLSGLPTSYGANGLSCEAWVWMRSTASANVHTIVSLADSGSNNNWLLHLYANAVDGDIEAARRSPAAFPMASQTTFSSNRWHHVGGNFDTASTIAYLDGVGGTEVTTSCTPTSIDNFRIGRDADQDSSAGVNWDGWISWLCVRNTTLTEDEFAAIAKGTPTWLVRPENIVSLYPLMEQSASASAIDIVGTDTLAVSSDPPVGDRWPPVSYPMPMLVTRSAPVTGKYYNNFLHAQIGAG